MAVHTEWGVRRKRGVLLEHQSIYNIFQKQNYTKFCKVKLLYLLDYDILEFKIKDARLLTMRIEIHKFIVTGKYLKPKKTNKIYNMAAKLQYVQPNYTTW